jgi:hypothetical protein
MFSNYYYRKSSCWRKPDYDELVAKVKHLRKICNGIYSNGVESGAYSDITINALGKTYDLNRIVLLNTPYFKPLLGGNRTKPNHQEIQLQFDDPNITIAGLDIVFKRMYGCLDYRINDDNIYSAVAAGAFFQDESLCTECIKYIREDLTPDNTIQYLKFAEEAECRGYSKEIVKAVFNYVCQNAFQNKNVQRKVLPYLSVQWLERIVGSDYLFMPSEFDRYQLLKDLVLECKKLSPSHEPLFQPEAVTNANSKKKSSQTKRKQSLQASGVDGKENQELTKKPKSSRTCKLTEEELLGVLSRTVLYTHIQPERLISIESDGLVKKEQLTTFKKDNVPG